MTALVLGLLVTGMGLVSASAPPVTTVMWDAASLASSKAEIKKTDSPLQPAFNALFDQAKLWRNESAHGNTFSVMTKAKAGPSGDKHDFTSLGTYWWPNNDTKDGLPYVHRDGFVNPESFLYDSVPLSQMIFAVSNLSLAYYFTEDPTYCSAAGSFLETWFLANETKMNPVMGLEYSQIIRGVEDEGRGIGIIDAKDLAFVFDSARLLLAVDPKGCDGWGPSDNQALFAWLDKYMVWLATSQHAKDEFNAANNHGTWFDVQAASLSLHAGNASWATFTAEDSKTRIQVQIEPDGSMPKELARTRSMHYTWWNMIAFFELAHFDSQIPVDGQSIDLFQYETSDGRSLRKALDFVAPYATLNATWPYPEETPFDHGKFFQIFRMASRQFQNSTYESWIKLLPGNVAYSSNVINLLWPKLY